MIFLSCLYVIACQPTNNDSQQTSDESSSLNKGLAEQLQVKYEIITNRKDELCDENQADGFCFQAKLTLTSPMAFDQTNWKIYFSNMAPVQMDESDLFDIRHINGDLHVITPTKSFTGFAENTSYEIKFRAGFWHLSHTDMMPNYYLVENGKEPQLITSTVPTIDPITGLEQLNHIVELTHEPHHFKRTPNDNTSPATAEWLYQENQPNNVVHDVTTSILPTPKSVKYLKMAGMLDLSGGINLSLDGINREGIHAGLVRLAKFGVKESGSGVEVAISQVQNLADEEYQLSILRNKISIAAATDTGAFYALQSIASLLMPNSLQLPFVSIEDEPRFEFRGMHVDVSRNFKSKAFIMQLLDQMAAYKLNKFHFHLADDEGWRVEIPDLPELTEVGATKCHDLSEQDCVLPQLGSGPNKDSVSNGYYTIEDYKEILQYAAARHIQVIPSMDMPGHSRAAIKAMEARFKKLTAQGQHAEASKYVLHDVEDSTEYRSVQFYNDNTINACMDSSYTFVHKVIDELQLMHAQSNNPLTKYHIGADETEGAWVESPACKSLLTNNVMGIEKAEDIAAYFIERVSNILAEKGIQAAGWNDGMGHTDPTRMPKDTQSNAWSPLMWNGHNAAHEQTNRGWQMVLSSPDALYFDFPYEADAHERGYYWAARRVNTKKVFQFMPENLPAHAEFWLDREENPYTAENSTPLKKGMKFHGMQGQLWSETVRTDDQASYMIFPRLYAVAERAWHKADWELSYDYEAKVYSPETNYFGDERKHKRDIQWQRFANHLAQKTLVKAEIEDVFFRLPTPGAVIEEGQLKMNSIFPGLAMEYQVSGGDWQSYIKPVAVTGAVKVRTASKLGPRKGRYLELKQ
ncbi:MAG: carbohydate-binding domain-containing protein [Gammaproteobacteria bacterium]|nr:carbohydate-binding domain-containing protein [Gammaproteobacteria bacterium]